MTSRRRSLKVVAERVRARENPRSHRVRIHIPVTIERDGERSTGIILNLSEDGFRMESSAAFAPEQVIKLLRDKEAVSAKIQWVEGSLIGGSFTEGRPQW